MIEFAPILIVAMLGGIVWRRHMRILRNSELPEHHKAPEEQGDTCTPQSISIIVPARNEAHALPALLTSLKALDPAPLEIIVVDDHSTDGTGDIARAAGVTVVTPPPLPEDWNGKPWACAHGAARARGSYLLFTDADTVHAKNSLAVMSAHREATGAGLLSAVPTHIVACTWERLQCIFHLLLLVATGAGVAQARGERRFMIGQYLLLSREIYDRIGGHAAVASRIAEDLALGRLVAEAGGRTHTVCAPGLLRVRMYPNGLRSFLAGWRRSFHDGLASAGVWASLEVAAVMGWLLGAPMLIAISAFTGDSFGLAIGLALYAAAVTAIAYDGRELGDFSVPFAFLYPLFAIFFCFVSVSALRDRITGAEVRWKGRRVTPRIASGTKAASP